MLMQYRQLIEYIIITSVNIVGGGGGDTSKNQPLKTAVYYSIFK